MSVLIIEDTALRLAKQIVDGFKQRTGATLELTYDSRGKLLGDFESIFPHQGLYGFCLCKGEKTAIAYIGKSEGDSRLRQHLTGKNKNGTQLAKSVNTKHREIKDAIANDFTVHLCLYSDVHFNKSSLACLEISVAMYSESDCAIIFPDLQHWNKRIG